MRFCRTFEKADFKGKSPSYVALLHLNIKADVSLNASQMLQIVKSCEGDEFLSYYPQWAELFAHVEKRFRDFCERIQFLSPGAEKSMSSEESEALERYLEWRGKGESSSLEFFRDTSVPVKQLAVWMNVLSPPNLALSNSLASKKTVSQPKRKPVPASMPFSIGQPDFGSATKTSKKTDELDLTRKKELDKLDRLIDQFKASDLETGKPACNKSAKPSGNKKLAKKKSKKKGKR